MGKKTESTKAPDDTMELPRPSDASAGKRRKTKAALAAGAVASTVAATAAYRRRNARRHVGNTHRPAAPSAL